MARYTIQIGKQTLKLDNDGEADALLDGLQRLRQSDDVIGGLRVRRHRSLQQISDVKNREVQVTKEA